MTKKNDSRKARKAATRQRVIEGAREAFKVLDYNEATIRGLAKAIGMSTGAVYANFEAKDDLWREAMGTNPPVDGPMTRAAPMLASAAILARTAIKVFGDSQSETCMAAVKKIDAAIELASSPLDGEAWARHLADTLPNTAAPQPGDEAGVLPPGGAGRPAT